MYRFKDKIFTKVKKNFKKGMYIQQRIKYKQKKRKINFKYGRSI
jgi:hypothetical protein